MNKKIWQWGILLTVFALLLATCGSLGPGGNTGTVKGFPKKANGYELLDKR